MPKVSLCLVLLVIAILYPCGASAVDKPNFVTVLGDDVGWDAFGCTGTSFARTPNIDELSTQSLHMDRFYCSVSQCAPLRAELYTGLYPNHNGVLANARSVNRPGVKNVADHLKPLGYRIGLTGKKHFGKGTVKFDKIAGFPEGANGSIGEYSLDGVKSYIQIGQELETPRPRSIAQYRPIQVASTRSIVTSRVASSIEAPSA